MIYDPSETDPIGLSIPFLESAPSWLILGGLGDSNEVGPALSRWPGLKVIGVDPDPRSIAWQRKHGWPAGQPLVESALSDCEGVAKINMSSICCASLHPSMIAIATPEDLRTVETTTLDTLYRRFNIRDCVVWLDLESWDSKALMGANDLLASREVRLLCCEIRYEQEDESREISSTMQNHGFQRARVWGRQWWGHNEFWIPKEKCRRLRNL